MMSYRMAATMVLAAGLTMAAMVGGCARRQAEPEAAPPADRATIERLRQRYAQMGDVRVGVVTDVLHEDRLAEVGNVQSEDFRVGQPLNFIDSNDNILVPGEIIRILPGELHVRYLPPRGEKRAPRVGDLAVQVR